MLHSEWKKQGIDREGETKDCLMMRMKHKKYKDKIKIKKGNILENLTKKKCEM